MTNEETKEIEIVENQDLITQERQEQEEKEAKIAESQILLRQMDYSARKVAFEVAAILKQLHPEIPMPIYEKYKESEAKAQEWRKIIDELRG